MKLALIEWTTNIQKELDWKDREVNNGIYNEEYSKTKTLKFLKIPLFKVIYKFKGEHELNEFDKNNFVGFKNNG